MRWYTLVAVVFIVAISVFMGLFGGGLLLGLMIWWFSDAAFRSTVQSGLLMLLATIAILRLVLVPLLRYLKRVLHP